MLHEVGHGSTGTVYLSHDPFYGRDVAIKLYHATGGDDAARRNARRMFLGEAHMIGKLHHPNIVPIFDAGEENGRRYVVTENIHGARTLLAYCRGGSLLPVDQVVQIVYKCAKALHYAHSRGVVHRDIKPSNILLTQDGDVRIVDFGLAIVSDSERLACYDRALARDPAKETATSSGGELLSAPAEPADATVSLLDPGPRWRSTPPRNSATAASD